MNKTLNLQIAILLIVSCIKGYLNELLFLNNKYILWLILICFIGSTLIFKKRKIKLYFIDIIVLVLCLLGCLTYFKTTTVNYYHIKIWYYLGYLITYFITRQLIYSREHIQKTIQTVVLTISVLGMINAIIGSLQYFNIISSPNPHFKVVGLFFSPNQLGALLGLGILCLLIYTSLNSHGTITKTLVYSSITFQSIVLLVTESRGALLALFISLFFFNFNKIISFFKKSTRTLTLITSVFFINGLGLFFLKFYEKNPDSIYGRYFILKTSLSQIIQNPLGYGIASFAKQYNISKADYFKIDRSWQEIKNADFVYHAFNDLIELTFEMGVLWIIIFLYLLLLLLNFKNQSIFSKMAKSLIIFLSIFAMTNTIIIFPFFIIIAIIATVIMLQLNTQPIFIIKNTRMIKTIYLIPILLLIIIIPQRINAELNLFNLKNSSIDSLNIKNIHNSLKKINHNGKASYLVSMLLKRKGDQTQVIHYLDSAFQKSGMPSIGRRLAYEYKEKGNLKKAIEIFTYNKQVEPYRYEAKMDLFNLYSMASDIPNSLILAKEITNFPTKISSEKINKYKKRTQNYIETYQKTKTDSSLYGIMSLRKAYKSTILNKKIEYYIYQPPLNKIKEKLPVLYVNDGVPYIKKGLLVKKADSLIHKNIISPIIIVFIDPKDLNAPELKRWRIREELYLTNDLYSDFLTKELFTYLERRYPASTQRSIMGLSFGGLSAAYTAIKNPTIFENVILQSPAFYPRKEIYKLYKTLPKQNFNIYISYGTGKDTKKQDIPFIKIIKEKKYNMELNIIYEGNHNWKNWEPQLNDILIKYYGKHT